MKNEREYKGDQPLKAAQISMGICFLATNTSPLPGCSLLIFMSVIP
jgi:hypothetical protein